MGILNDFIGVLQDFNHVGNDVLEDTINKRRYSSISRRAMEGTMHFPTIVSRSIDIDTLQMITKALEKQFASFTQVALTMSPFLSLKHDKDAIGYMRKFHQNMGRSSVKDDFFNVLATSPISESVDYSVFRSEKDDIVIFTAIGEGCTPRILKTNKEGLDVMMEGLRESCLNDMYQPSTNFRTSNDYLRRKYSPVAEASGKPKRGQHAPQGTPQYLDASTHVGTVQGDGMRIKDATIHQNVTMNVKGGGRHGSLEMPGGNVDQKLPNKVLQDNDVKKANELVPSTMHVRTTLLDKDGSVAGNMDFIAGIKATMHPVDSTEIVKNLVDGIKNRGKLFKFIRWTTGEIQFARDYLFNLTEIKEDAVRTTSKSSRWWTALKRRGKLAKFKKAIFLPGDILPNASIVISLEEADFIKREYGFDLLDSRVAYKLINEYFLIAFAVIDTGGQIAHFLFDGNEDYQTVTFSGLERGDLNGGGVDFKDVLKLVQRV